MATAESASDLELVVCTCGEERYTVRDVIDFEIFRGELNNKWKNFLTDVAAEERAYDLDLDADETAVSAAAEQFRYDHDLISAEETEAWLAGWNLTFDEFSDYFTRRYHAGIVDENVVAEEVEYGSASSEMRQSFFADLVLSGEFERITTDLIWRLGASCAEVNVPREAISIEERRFFERTGIKPPQLASWLKRVERDSKWFGKMLALEAAYYTCCERILVPKARQRELIGLQQLLIRFETEVIEMESRDAAQEALFCVREDGMSMEQVAAEGRYPYRQVTFVLEDIPADAQQKFISIAEGEILGPIARGDGFELCRVIKKIEPDADDSRVQSRIDQRLLKRYFSDLASKFVRRQLGSASTPAQ